MKPAVLAQKKCSEIDWGALENSLYDRFQVNAVALNSTGDRMTEGPLPPENDLCALIRKHPEGMDRICDALKKMFDFRSQKKEKVCGG